MSQKLLVLSCIVAAMCSVAGAAESSANHLDNYVLGRLHRVKDSPGAETKTGVEVTASFVLNEYCLLDGKLQSETPMSFADEMPLMTAARWRDVEFLLDSASTKQCESVKALIPQTIRSLRRSDCEIALLSASDDGTVALWGIGCVVKSPSCAYSMDCFVVDTKSQQILAQKELCNVCINTNFSGFVRGDRPACFVVDNGTQEAPTLLVVDRSGFRPAPAHAYAEGVFVSPDGSQVVITKRVDSGKTLEIGMWDSLLSRPLWRRRLQIDEPRMHPSAVAYWSQDSAVIAVEIEKYPGRSNAVTVLRAEDGLIVGAFEQYSDLPLSADLVAIYRKDEKSFAPERLWGVRALSSNKMKSNQVAPANAEIRTRSIKAPRPD